MTKKKCPLGENCDLTIAWMAGRQHAIDRYREETNPIIEAQAAEIERLVKERDAAVHLAHMRKTFIEEARDERDAREAKLAKAVEALEALIQQTHNCEKELTEDLHHMDFCGESEPLTRARATLAELTGGKDE